MTTPWYVWVPGLAVSGLILCAVVWVNFIGPWHAARRRRELVKFPCDAYFVANDERGQHRLRTVVVPAHKQLALPLRIRPNVVYTEKELLFGFGGAADLKPAPIKVFNDFVKIGQTREMSPQSNPDHYIDQNDIYHIKGPKKRTPNDVQAVGFVVRTRAEGDYPVRLVFYGDEADGFPTESLTVSVRDKPDREMICTNSEHKNCSVSADFFFTARS